MGTSATQANHISRTCRHHHGDEGRRPPKGWHVSPFSTQVPKWCEVRHHSNQRLANINDSRISQLRTTMIIVLAMLCLAVPLVQADCPAINLIHRLMAPNGAPVNRYLPSPNSTDQCDCTTIDEGGWEITCYTREDETEAKKPKLEFDFDEFVEPMDFSVLHTWFTVRYEIGRQLKLTCDKGVPAFKPALFQGFGVEQIDTFVINKCELPVTLPLSVILYRTQPNHGFSITSTFGDSSYSINTTGHTNPDPVAPIRNLYIKSSQPITIPQLNTLLSDLESLEQLTLSEFSLSDIDQYMVEKVDNHLPLIDDFAIDRVKRNVTNDVADLVLETTTEASLPEFTMPLVTESRQEVTTAMPSSEPPMNSTEPSRVMVEEITTMETPNLTDPPQFQPIDSNEPEINGTRIGKENSELELEEASNHVNVENKPIIALDESVLSFARILPNLRLLRLRDFVKESTIPNVIFQIINGLNKLEYLELNANNISSIPSNSLSFAGQSLKKLYLFRNEIKEVDEKAFNNLTRLEILDLSNNKISELKDYTLKPLKNLMHLSLKNNLFERLSEYLLQSNKKLVSLDLSQNRNLKPLPGNILHGMQNLANFSMAYCNLSEVSSHIQFFFRNVPNLSRLDLKGNQLSNLTMPGLFAWNSKLSKLDVSNNRITEISRNIFSSNSTHIVEINLNKNLLTELPENLFLNTRNLRLLSVASNRLSEISPMTFIQLRMLEELNLSGNQIRTLNPHQEKENYLPFGIGVLLRKVDLSNNNLTDFEAEILKINWNLYISIAEIDLKSNNFSGILEVPLFSASKETTIHLDVSSNRFYSVRVDNLISDASFREEPEMGLKARSWETLVRLDDNPFVCDCTLFPFLNYTRTIGHLFNKNYYHTILRKTMFLIDSTTNMVCAQPEEQRGRPLSNLQLDELICKIEERRVCPESCNCFYRTQDEAAIINCDRAGLSQLPNQLELSQLVNITLKDTNFKVSRVDNVIYQLRENNIQSVERLPAMLTWSRTDDVPKPSMVEIFLDKNNITHLPDDAIPSESIETSSLPLLRTLSLQDNNIQMVPLALLNNFENNARRLGFEDNQTESNLKMDRTNTPIQAKLLLANNPFDCHNEPMPLGSECYLRDFKLWLSSHPSRVSNANQVMCANGSISEERLNGSSLVIVNLNDEVLCPVMLPSSSGALLALSLVCIVLASSLFVVSVLYYRNKQIILAFIYIHLNPIFICLSFTEDDLDEDKIYDAFVSYSSSDRDVVMELIEKLEKPYDLNEVSLILQNGSSIHEGKVDQIVPENEFKKSATLKAKEADAEVGGEEQSYRLCIHERDWLPGNLISWNIVNSVQNSKRTILILSQSFIQSIWFQVEFHTAYYQMLEDRMDRLIVIVRGELPPKEQLDKDLNFLLTTKTYLVWGEKWFWEKLYYAMPHKKRQPVFTKNKTGDKSNKLSLSNSKSNGITPNGVNYKDGMLKWSYHNGSTGKNGKAEAMRDYVDQTIATHFQLNSLSPVVSTPKPSETRKPAPKSLRNSGTLATASPATLQVFDTPVRHNGGYDNQSFINETNT